LAFLALAQAAARVRLADLDRLAAAAQGDLGRLHGGHDLNAQPARWSGARFR
jgi:hypothetical protein